MTATVNDSTRAVIDTGPLGNMSTALGLIVIAALITLLFQKELFRAEGGARWTLVSRTLDTAIVPLVIAAGFIVAFRVLDIANVL